MNKTQTSTSNLQRSSKVQTANLAGLELEDSLVLGGWNLDVALIHPWLKTMKVNLGKLSVFCPKKIRNFFRRFCGESLGNQPKMIRNTLQNCPQNMPFLIGYQNPLTFKFLRRGSPA